MFKTLRKNGFYARMNLMCCQTCACAELGDMAKKRGDKPYVYWHGQDEACGRSDNKWWLAFGHTDDDADETEHVGRMIKLACEVAGLKVEWDGSAMYRIMVTAA